MTEITPTDLVILEKDNPNSIYNLLPTAVRTMYDKHMATHAELFNLDESELKKALKEARQPISPTDNQLRFQMWMEYNRALTLPDPRINMGAITTHVCTNGYFYTHYITSPHRLAWMLCKPMSYEGKIGEAVTYGLDKMRDILEMAPYKKDGSFDHKLAEMQIKITIWMDQRKHGSIVQRSEQKNVNVQLTGKDKDIINQIAGTRNEKDLKHRIAQLESVNRKLQHLPADGEREIPNESAIVEKTDN